MVLAAGLQTGLSVAIFVRRLGSNKTATCYTIIQFVLCDELDVVSEDLLTEIFNSLHIVVL